MRSWGGTNRVFSVSIDAARQGDDSGEVISRCSACTLNRTAVLLLLGVALFSIDCSGVRRETLAQSVEREPHHSDSGIVSTLEVVPTGSGRSLQVTFTLSNTTDHPLSFVFSSSQQYDFIVEDATGSERWRWSSGRFFAMVLLEKKLYKDPWVYVEEVPLADGSGAPFGPGTYTLRAQLAADPSLNAQTTFGIE